MTRRTTALMLAATLFLAATPTTAGALAKAPKQPDYTVAEDTLPFGAAPGHEDSTRLWGVLHGAGYRVEVPVDWNGRLVMWAHGYVSGDQTSLEFGTETFDPGFRLWLLDHGYAWAASTYSKNGYQVAQGVKDTHALAERFNGLVAHPDQVFIVGGSMGGHVTAVSAEQFPQSYVGAMPVCGVLGDYELFDFYLDFNVAAQQLALGESAYPVDDPITYIFGTAQTIKSQLEAVPGGWPLALNSTGLGFKQLVELRSGGDRPNFDAAWYFWNTFPSFGSGIPGNFLFDLGSLDGTNPGRPGIGVDNTDTVYQLDLDPALSPAEEQLNADIARVAADPSAINPNGLSNIPVTTGDLRIPMLTLHNLGDLFVPFLNEEVYARRVAEKGNSANLVQRAIRGVNHCGFTTNELVTAFADLVAWVEDGTVPAGDIVADPAVVAAPDYGCAFTDFDTPGGHLLAEPCP